MTPPRPPAPARRPRGTGFVSLVWQGGRWRYKARFPDGSGGTVPAGTWDSEDAAHRALNGHVEARRARGGPSGGESLDAYGQRWLGRLPDRNKRAWQSTWRTVVAAAPWAQEPLDSVTRADVRDWARGLREHVSAQTGRPIAWQTQKHALGLVRRCLAEALEDGLITANPAAGVKLPPRPERADEWTHLDEDEIAQLLEHPALPEGAREVFATAIFTGLRQGELAALSWDRVELGARPQLVVDRSWDGPTKSGRARVVPLLPVARAVLRRRWLRLGRPKAGPVFGNRKGEHHARGHDWRWAPHADTGAGVCWLGWRYRVGLRRPIRFHDLRHTFASHLVMGTWGRVWTLPEVRDVLGHTSASVTERYAHLSPKHLHAAAAATRRRGGGGAGGAPPGHSGGTESAPTGGAIASTRPQPVCSAASARYRYAAGGLRSQRSGVRIAHRLPSGFAHLAGNGGRGPGRVTDGLALEARAIRDELAAGRAVDRGRVGRLLIAAGKPGVLEGVDNRAWYRVVLELVELVLAAVEAAGERSA